MSLESAITRLNELHALTAPEQPAASVSASGTAAGTAQGEFSTYLTAAQTHIGPGGSQPALGPGMALPSATAPSSLALAGSSPASGLPLLNAAPGAELGASAGLSTPYAGIGMGLGVGSGQYGLGTIGGIPGVSGLYGSPGVSPTYPGAGGAGARMVALAQGELGVSESPPGSNNAPRIKTYRTAVPGAENTPGPWCAYFVSWLAKESGAPIGEGGRGTGWVPSIESWGKSSGRWHTDSTRAQPGDIVIFDRNGDGLSDHTGIVESVDASGRVRTIEGNTSDRVARRDYAPSQIKGYVRPG